ncbi:MAG: C4-dicarboxylate ABC transporter substrate-binding protein [Bradyrhizobiaceae bacterium]|nr:MAG: C4-dicarboxylate ABC transporter substrate-binding protein [Bradyrhizobiaceae bacterium]
MLHVRQLVAAGALAAAAAMAQPAVAADHVIRLTHGMPEALDSGQHAWALVFKETVEARSAGKIEVRILGNNAAGNERQQLERVQNGINQMILVSEITQPFFFKPALVLGTPFLFPSSEVAWAVFDGPWGQKYNEAFQKQTGIRIVGHIESGFRSFFNSKKPIKTPADLAGMKIRTGENAVHMAMVRALGGSPTPVSWTEVYTALQQKVVDGMENPPGLFFSMKFHEQQKYLTLNKHLYSVHTAMINEAFFQGLPADLRGMVIESARLATTIGRSQAYLLERAALEKLKGVGIEIYTPTPAEFEQFRKIGQPPALELVRKEIGSEWVDGALKAVADAEKALRAY